MRKVTVIGKGKDCPKCNLPMERRKHNEKAHPHKKCGYSKWDYCKPCLHIQHYAEFRK